MPGAKLLLMALLAAGRPAGAESAGFTCERLADVEGPRIFDGIGRAEAVPAAPVRLQKGARLARLVFPLTVRASTFDDAALATDGGTVPALSFRPFLINGRSRACTSTLRESVFGPPRADGDFSLRCLVDRDGDGRFESFLAYVEPVRINKFTRRQEEPSGDFAQVRPLPRAVRLIDHHPKDGKTGLVPRVVEVLRVGAMTADRFTLESRAWVSAGTDAEGAQGRGEKKATLDVPLREGFWTSPRGLRLQLNRKGGEWFALLLAPGPGSARLQCGGAVIDTGGEYTIMFEDQMSQISGLR